MSFTITSTRPIEWPSFALRKGENVFPSRRSVPVELWEKLDRWRGLKIVSFEGKAEVGPEDRIRLDSLTQVQLYALDKASLGELAKAEGVELPADASKAMLLAQLEQRLPPGAIAQARSEEAGPVAAPSEGESVVVASRRKRGG